jgi:hypothetical protein
MNLELPVRSAVLKHCTGGLVVRWVTTSESPLLYVFAFSFCLNVITERAHREQTVLPGTRYSSTKSSSSGFSRSTNSPSIIPWTYASPSNVYLPFRLGLNIIGVCIPCSKMTSSPAFACCGPSPSHPRRVENANLPSIAALTMPMYTYAISTMLPISLNE